MGNKSGDVGIALVVIAAFFGAFIVSVRRAWGQKRRENRAAAMEKYALEKLEDLPE